MKTCKTNIFQACPLAFYLSPPFVLIVLYLFLSWLLDFFGWDVLWRMEKITFIFGFSNIQNILTLRQLPSQKRRKIWGGGEPLNESFFFSPLPPAKCDLKQSRYIWGYRFCLLTSSGFQSEWSVRKPEEKEVQDEEMPYSGIHQARRKTWESKQFFIENFSLGETELFIEKVLLGEGPNHFCPSHSSHDSHSWSLLGGFSFLLNSLRLFLAERAFHKSGPTCTYILVCITNLPGRSGLSIHLFASPHTAAHCHYPQPPLFNTVRSLAFQPSKTSQDWLLLWHVEEISHTVVGDYTAVQTSWAFLFQPCCVLHTECPAQHGVCMLLHAKLLTPTYLQYWAVTSLPWDTLCEAQRVCLSSDWQTGSASRKDAAVALQQENCCGAGVNPWAALSGRGALPGGQTQPCAAFLSPCTQPDTQGYLKLRDKMFETSGYLFKRRDSGKVPDGE